MPAFDVSMKVEHQLTDPSNRDQLNRHNVLEHDASLRYVLFPSATAKFSKRKKHHRLTFPLSRLDAYYGNNHLFNPSTFASSKSFWTTSLLSAQQLANSKLARQIDSRAYNPDYTFTATMEQFSLGELAAPIIAFGDSEKGTADRALVEYFFGKLFLRCPKEGVTKWFI